MQSRKLIITVSGVALFLLAGAFTMLFLPSESSPKPQAKPRTSAPAPAPVAPVTESVPEPVKPASSPEKSSSIFVYITGAVKKPGVYKLTDESRIFEAINAAGGFTKNADQAAINLAEELEDKMHIDVPEKGQSVRASSPSLSQANPQPQSGLVDINRADVHELQRIKSIGPATAQKIVDYRQTHGGFSRLEDIINVKGIGRKKFEQMRSQITITGGKSSSTSQSTSSPSSPSSSLVDINRATLQELQRIKGVGVSTAQRIIDYRQKHGSFSRAEDLLNVRGIGASKLNQIRGQIIIR